MSPGGIKKMGVRQNVARRFYSLVGDFKLMFIKMIENI
jgi:hypothetical protein